MGKGLSLANWMSKVLALGVHRWRVEAEESIAQALENVKSVRRTHVPGGRAAQHDEITNRVASDIWSSRPKEAERLGGWK